MAGLDTKWVICRYCRAGSPAGVGVCPRCGEAIRRGRRDTLGHGEDTTAETVATPHASNPSRRLTIARIMIVIAVVAVVAAFFAWTAEFWRVVHELSNNPF